jgi:hypothetical protein
MGLPADFHSFCPYWKGAKPSRVARSRYMPALTVKVNCPPRLARTDWGAADAIHRPQSHQRARQRAARGTIQHHPANHGGMRGTTAKRGQKQPMHRS